MRSCLSFVFLLHGNCNLKSRYFRYSTLPQNKCFCCYFYVFDLRLFIEHKWRLWWSPFSLLFPTVLLLFFFFFSFCACERDYIWPWTWHLVLFFFFFSKISSNWSFVTVIFLLCNKPMSKRGNRFEPVKMSKLSTRGGQFVIFHFHFDSIFIV